MFHHAVLHGFNLVILYFTDGTPPDGLPCIDISTYSVALVVVFYALTLAGIVFAIVCLLFNWIFRKSKYLMAA